MEPKTPVDLRVQKTRQALVTALMDLVVEESWPKTTVAAICRRARIHRAAFYRSILSEGAEFRRMFSQYLVAHAKATQPGGLPRLSILFATGGILGVLEWFVWQEPLPDPDETAEALSRLLEATSGSRGKGQGPQ